MLALSASLFVSLVVGTLLVPSVKADPDGFGCICNDNSMCCGGKVCVQEFDPDELPQLCLWRVRHSCSVAEMSGVLWVSRFIRGGFGSVGCGKPTSGHTHRAAEPSNSRIAPAAYSQWDQYAADSIGNIRSDLRHVDIRFGQAAIIGLLFFHQVCMVQEIGWCGSGQSRSCSNPWSICVGNIGTSSTPSGRTLAILFCPLRWSCWR